MHERIHRLGWCGVHRMHRGHVQERERIRRLHAVLARQVQHSSSSDRRGYVQRLPCAYVLGAGERVADPVHLQRRLHGARRRHVCRLRGGQVQDKQRLGAVHRVLPGQVLDRDGRCL